MENGSAALSRLQQMLNVPPASRPAEFVNPVEKIEELLTCAVCLDRFKTPKLLPCQHTFCMEPCLEGLVDPVRRTVKCPECRAEHSLPYDGVKSYQTNYTLMGFLEIHLQASEDNAEELESYIRRYNMDRCKVCDEKAEVDYCFHCEKRVCLECKTSHTEMIKRDLARLMNQIKRLSNRVTESSDGLSKGVESLTLNCETTKEEIKDYVKRYMKELKKKEDHLLEEINIFFNTEARLMRNLRDSLELESSNITEACARVDAILKGEREASEEDMVHYKHLFVEGLDYLRSFHIDADDLFSKKIRFSVGQDPNQLPAAIKAFGELQTCVAQFGGRFQQLEAAYVPKMFNLGLESDQKQKNRNYDFSDSSTWQQHNDKRRGTKTEDDHTSLRYRRRQQLEEEAWNRLRNERHGTETNRRSPNTRTHGHDDHDRTQHEVNEVRQLVKKSPWSDIQTNSHQSTGETSNKHKHPQLQTNSSGSMDNSSPGPSAATSSPQSTPAPAIASSSKSGTSSSASGTTKKPPLPRQESSSEDPALNEKIDSIRREHEKRQTDEKIDSIRREHEKRQTEAKSSQTKTSGIKTNAQTKAATRLERSKSDESGASSDNEQQDGQEHEESEATPAAVPVAVTVFPGKTKEEIKEKETRPKSNRYNKYGSRTRDPSPAEENNRGALDWKKYLIPSPKETKKSNSINNENNDETIDESEMTWLERRKRFIRSKTNPELLPSPSLGRMNDLASGPSPTGVGSNGFRNRFLESLHNTEGRNEKKRRTERQDSNEGEGEGKSSNDRRSRYRRKAERNNTISAVTNNETQQDSPRVEISVNSGDSKIYRVFTQPKADYLAKGRMLLKYGTKGAINGAFNWPRGVALIPNTDEIAICDSSNHRVQIFNGRGVFQRTFGKYGNGKGEFDCLAGMAANKFNQIIVSDRYNHRVQVFEANGRFVREFGSHGQTNGRFHNPWGVVVDQQGFTYVCDKDNHRVQIFQADGNFVGKFGTIGSREGQFQNPHFIAVNRQNQLVVTDSSNHRVQIFDHNGHFLYAFGSEGFHDGQFKYPRGVAVDDQGFVLVADSGNNRIQVFYPDGRFYASFGSWGSGDGQLKGVEGVAVLPDGKIIVTDRENHRVQIF